VNGSFNGAFAIDSWSMCEDLMPTTFGQLLRHYRLRAGLTKSELAEALGAGRSSITDWEAEKRVPRDRARLEDLTQALRLAPDEAEQLAATARRRSSALTAEDPLVPGADQRVADGRAALVTPRRHQLRAPIADFVGRADETERLVQAMQTAAAQGQSAIISAVQGMGGIGKTELAYRVAHCLRDAFSDAQLVVELQGSIATPLTPTQALQQLIQAFSPEVRIPDDPDALPSLYRSVLHNRRALILADDARDAAQVRPLVPPAGSALLITSRQRFTLPGMTTIHLEQLGADAAVTLLRTICPRLSLADARAIAQVCGYLPLALRISGSMLHNIPALSVSTYLARLANEQQRLTQLRDPDDAQLDVAASLMLSYALLDATAQQVFRQLGVLVADFSTEMALALLETPPEVEDEAILHVLQRRNLVMYDTARARWHMHDLVRDLARRLLTEAGELDMMGWRYARAAVQIAQGTQELFLKGGANVHAALARFDADRLHLEAARTWAAAHMGTPAGDALLRDDALATIHIGGELRYHLRHERLPQLDRALAAAQRLDDQVAIGRILQMQGYAYGQLGDLGQAVAIYQQRLTLAQVMGDRDSESLMLNNLGLVYLARGDVTQAHRSLEQALMLAQEIGNQRREGYILDSLGLVLIALRKLGPARTILERALRLAQVVGDQRLEAAILTNLGLAYLVCEDIVQAIQYGERALAITGAIGDQHGEGRVLSILGQAYAAHMERDRAVAAFEQALGILQSAGDRGGESECCWHYGLFLDRQGKRSQALPLLRASVTYMEEIGHIQAAEYVALLARLEAGEALPPELFSCTLAD
jgi:tetratricopeptide (TPR) repeat protein/transcriptional regulator with XRE-family HTH domain